jgi:hypothetical protein
MNTQKNITILSSTRTDNKRATEFYSGGTCGERFVRYLKKKLLSSLNRADIVIMDNIRSHHVKGICPSSDRIMLSSAV